MKKTKMQTPEAEVDKFLEDISHGGMGLKSTVNKFIDDNGSHKEFVGFVGSATVGLAKKYKALGIAGEVAVRVRTNETEAIVELTRSLGEKNEKLRKDIKKMTGEVEKEPSKEAERKPSEEDRVKFVEDNFLGGEKRKFNPIKANDAFLEIRAGKFSPEDTAKVMDRLIEEYYWEGNKKKAVQLEERIRTVNTVLAGEYQDLNYALECEKRRSEFRDLKAA